MRELLETVRAGYDTAYNGWNLAYNKMYKVYIGRKNDRVVQRKSAAIFAQVIR